MNGLIAVLRNRFGRVLLSVLACATFIGSSAYADAPPPQELGVTSLIAELGSALEQSRKDTAGQLSRLGFAPQVNELLKVDNVPVYAFSSHSIIEGLYRRAEAQKAGEGSRFLAVLYKDIAAKSGVMAVDPDFAVLRRYSAESLDLKRYPIVFGPLQSGARTGSRAPLPPAMERAIHKIATHYSGRSLAQARTAVLKNFRRPGFDGREFERTLAENTSSKDVWLRLINLGTPPPRAEIALRGILVDAMAGSAALSSDPAALAVMEELSKDLPPEVERYIHAESKLESRLAQAKEAARMSQPAKTRPSDKVAIIGLLSNEPPPSPPSDGPDIPPPSQSGPPKPGPKPGPTPSHPHRPMNAEAQSFAKRYSDYTSITMEPRPVPAVNDSRLRPTNGTPRTYRTAIRSARAGRGVSAGGQVQSEIKPIPARAVWLSNRKDDRFGRLFVKFGAVAGKPSLIGASRVLFADSFYAAISALWGKHNDEAQHREGELLILMSMDPNSAVTTDVEEKSNNLVFSKLDIGERERVKRIVAELQELLLSAESLDEMREIKPRIDKLQMELEGLTKTALSRLDAADKIKLNEMTTRRGIVVHPALVGRELSWSAARIDFWTNRLDALSREAAAMNGGRPMPSALRKIKLEGRANTWQYFEFDSRVSLGEPKGRVAPLVVTSVETDGNGPASSAAMARSHFGISLFGRQPGPKKIEAEDGFYRLDDLERQLQPMLDWLATNHHDYMRLNDFSEAFSLLRWLKAANVQVSVIDIDGQGPAIATPDRVHTDIGPGTGN